MSPESNLPVPDPTRLTTELVDRAILGFREVVETRLNAADHAVDMARTGIAEQIQDRFDTAQRAISKAEDSINERLGQLTATLSTLATRSEGFITRAELAMLLDKFDERAVENVQTQLVELDLKSQMRLDAARRELDIWRLGLNERMGLINLATEKAAEAMNIRLAATNEWRADYNSQAANMVRRDMLDQVKRELEVRLEGQETVAREDRDRIRASQMTLVTHSEFKALEAKVDIQQTQQDRSEGRRSMSSLAVGSAISLIISLITVVVLVWLTKA